MSPLFTKTNVCVCVCIIYIYIYIYIHTHTHFCYIYIFFWGGRGVVLTNPLTRTITPVWLERSVYHVISCWIQICFRALAGAEPDWTCWALVILSQILSVFNHIMLILGFRHLNTLLYVLTKPYIYSCKILRWIYGSSNNDPYKYNLMTCFIDNIYRLCR